MGAATVIRSARTAHLLLMLPAWVLSSFGTGNAVAGIHLALRRELPAFRLAVRNGRAIVLRGGTAFACWQPHCERSWYLSYIASFPRGRRHGSTLLTELTTLADEAQVSIVLHCTTARIRWYRRHRFLLVPLTNDSLDRAARSTGLVKMRRLPVRRAQRIRRAE